VDRLPKCADCDIDTLDTGEFYMVHNELWAAAWAGRRVNCDCGAIDTHGGLQRVFEFNEPRRRGCERCKFLCIGCLEQRLGRALTRADFVDCRLNDPDEFTSARLRSRLERGNAA
jgi:hypothetical protein